MCDPSMPYFSFIVSLMLLCWQLGNSIIIITIYCFVHVLSNDYLHTIH